MGIESVNFEQEDVALVNVADVLKKFVAFGLGAAAFSAEKLKQFADEMVAKGELTSEEAAKFVDDISQRAEQEKKSLQDWMRDQMSKMLQQMGAAKACELAELEKRVEALEARLGVAEEEAGSSEEPLPPSTEE